MSLIGILKMYKGKTNRKLISRIYSALRMDRGLSSMYIKSKWEKEANMQLTEDDWLNICRTSCTTSSSDLWGEFTQKNVVRYFITPKMRSFQSNNLEHGQCGRGCGNTSAGHFHIFWKCFNISPYWQDVVTAIRSILKLQLDLSFNIIYLGNIPTELNKPDIPIKSIINKQQKGNNQEVAE